MPHHLRLVPLLLAALLALAGCVVATPETAPPDVAPPEAVPEPGPGELQTVPLRILESGDSTLALVPVTIDGQGPFLFALDTGASNTVVDTDVAAQVGLPETGEQRQVSGVIGDQEVPIARIEQWALGEVGLDPVDVALVDLPSPAGGEGLQGLLGSDVLRGFGYVVVDYDEERLGLGRP